MSFARNVVELALRACAFPGRNAEQPAAPESIFVLRNNDIGDLLVVTPMFEALKRTFPSARLCAGIGPWNNAVLANNPWVDEVMPISAPWHNKQTARHGPNTIAGWVDAWRYLATSSEVRALRHRRCAVGIDVLGSPQGSLLLMRAGIPYRIGVRGYAGGHTACQRWVQFDPELHVGRSALRVAELLGAVDLPRNRPQLYLTASEQASAEKLWRENEKGGARVLIAPGGGFAEKCAPASDFAKLAQTAAGAGCSVSIIGGPAEKQLGAEIANTVSGAADWTGKTSLRETFGLIAGADLVLCNSSMAMHAAAAFGKRTAVLLGPSFASARQHARQWGYDQDFLVLGQPADSPARTAKEAAALLQSKRWFQRPESKC